MATDLPSPARRRLFGGLLAAALPWPALAGAADTTRVVGCRLTVGGDYLLDLVDADSGETHWSLSLPGRGHDVVAAPGGALLAFARRPGTFIAVADTAGAWQARIQAPAGRHFCGHGVFSADGRWLFASGTDHDRGGGVILVFDAADRYRLVDELPSHGIGPHQIAWWSKDVLAVANGGIQIHPDFGRAGLNLDRMQPNLALVAAPSGRLLSRCEPPAALHQLSIRHLAVAGGTCCLAMQFQGAKNRRPPLVAFSDGERLRLAPAPAAVLERMRNYCGSVTWLPGRQRFAVSSPHRGVVTLWSAGGDFDGLLELAVETSALAADHGGELVAGGGEWLQRPALSAAGRLRTPGRLWDNHLAVL